MRTRVAEVSNQALARVAVDAVDASNAVQARGRETLIDVRLAIFTFNKVKFLLAHYRKVRTMYSFDTPPILIRTLRGFILGESGFAFH